MRTFITSAIAFLTVLSGAVHAQINMRIPDTTVVAGNFIDIPVYADNTLTGSNVMSYMIQVSFNTSCLQPISVITAGTISNGFGSPAVNTSVPGKVTIAGAGTIPLAGSGKFLYIHFKALQYCYTGVSFTGTANNYFNEGTPAMILHNGSVSISSPPSITVFPNSGLIISGETLQFGVTGGTAPYSWSVTNTTVAGISSSGLLTAAQSGLTKVVATDFNGLRDTSDSWIDIRAMRLTIPNNLSQWQGQDINVAVNTSDLTGLGIMAGSFTVTYNQNILTPFGTEQAGTLLSGYPAPVFNTPAPGSFAVDFAGTTPLSGSGTLLYLKFHVSAVNTGGTGINFSSGIFNETMVPVMVNGYFTTINLPVLSISPFSGTLVAGQTQQFTLTGGGAPPITWSVSDPTVATISSSGLLSTIQGGTITVTATDIHGATATSGSWIVYDARVTLPDTLTCPSAPEFIYPVFITGMPAGESVYSMQGTVTFNSTYLTFQNLVSAGTLAPGWTMMANAVNNQIFFAGSGVTPFSSAGVMLALRFTLKPAFTAGVNSYFSLQNLVLNQGVPNVLVDPSGYVSAVNGLLPVSITITPSGNPVPSGTIVTYTAVPHSGGLNPQYQWKVKSTVVAGATNQTYKNVPANNDTVICTLTSSGTCISGNPAVSNTIVMSVTGVPASTTVTGTVNNAESNCYNATGTITVAGGGSTFTVQPGGSATFIAGVSIDFLPGTVCKSAGYLHGYISPGPYCQPHLAPQVESTGEAEAAAKPPDGFSIFPNPTTGRFTLRDTESEPGLPLHVEIFTPQGKLISSNDLSEAPEQELQIENGLPGIYLVKAVSGSRVQVLKLLVTR